MNRLHRRYSNTPTSSASFRARVHIGARAWGTLALAIAGAWGATGATAQAQDFRIASLGESNVLATDRGGGDDKGGIGLSPTQVFNTGDFQTVRAPRDVSSTATVGAQYDGLVTELGSETLYTLITSDGAYRDNGDDIVTALERIDGTTGALTGERITLSQPFDSDVGPNRRLVLAGLGRVVVYNGAEVFDIALPSGVVTNRGAISISNISSSENWASWGVAEFFEGQLHLAFISTTSDSNGRRLIQRVRVSDGTLSTVASFSDLDDMASFVVSARTRRWFFHVEGGSFADPSDVFEELLGSADALAGTFVTNTLDSGPGSLRAAIAQVGALGGAIFFDLPAGSPGVIALQSPLPALGPGVVVDGLNSSAPVSIVLDGSAAGSGANGIVVTGSNSRVANLTIRNFSGKGIVVVGGVSSQFDRVQLQNSGQAIDLANDGLSPNDETDEDAGVNGLLNAPVLTSASTSTGGATVSGFYQGRPVSTFRLQFFASAEATTAGASQAATFLQEITVTTDTRGRAPISLSLPGVGAGAAITATATDTPSNALSSTSELSNAVAVNSGTLSLDASALSEALGSSATVPVRRTGGTSGTVRVNYTLAPGTATAADFTPASGTLVFAPGETLKLLPLPLINDLIDEEDETVSITLSNPTGGVLLNGSAFSISITDDDATPTLSLADVTLAEGASGAVTATLSNPSSRPVSFTYLTQAGTASSPMDFPVLGARLTFAPGATTVQIPLNALSDGVYEGSETFSVRVSELVNATLSREATVTITDADGPRGLSILLPTNGAAYRVLPTVLGAYNGPANVPVTVAIRNARGQFYNGRIFAAARTELPTLRGNDQFVLSTQYVPSGTVLPEGTLTLIATANSAPLTATATSTVIIDRTAPQLTIRTPAANLVSTLSEISGTVSDVRSGVATSGVKVVLVAIRRGDGAYWNGREFVRAFVTAEALITGTRWTLTRNLPTGADLSGGSYTIAAIGADRAGNRVQVLRPFTVASQRGS